MVLILLLRKISVRMTLINCKILTMLLTTELPTHAEELEISPDIEL